MQIKNLVHTLRLNKVRVGVIHDRFVQDSEDGSIYLDTVTKDNKKHFFRIMAKGGQTTTRLSFPDGSDYTETAKCSVKDSYNKKTGVSIAVERIFAKRAAEGKVDVLNNVTFALNT